MGNNMEDKDKKSKNVFSGYIILAVMLVIFNVISFAPPFLKNGVFWSAYVFGLISIVYQMYVFKVAFLGKENVKSRFYGFPIARIGAIYMIVQVLISIAEMVIAVLIPTWIVIIINIIPLAFAVVGCIAADTMRNEIERQDIKQKNDVMSMRELQMLSTSFLAMSNDKELNRKLQDLADDFRFSDPVSSGKTSEAEIELSNMLNQLRILLEDSRDKEAVDMCERVKSRLAERNRLCRLGK